MRRRRVGRCLLRADLALEDGYLSEARTALDEARQLDPSCELGELEARLASLQSGVARHDGQMKSSAAELWPSFQPSPVPATPSRRWFVPAIAGIVVMLAGGAMGSWYWGGARTDERVVAALTAPPPPSVALTTVEANTPLLRILRETIRAPNHRPELATDPPRLPSFPAPPIAAPPPEAEDQPVMAVNRPAPVEPPRVPLTPRSELIADTFSSTPPPEPLAKPAANTAAAPPAPPPDIAPPAPRSEPVVDDSSLVRRVLSRYERAYNSLDAEAASEIWPRVDRTALARAFEGLTSQRVSLQACDVRIDGGAAHARCSGTAMWVPKIGGGARTAARRWDFELRKAGDDWRIERAVTR